MLRPPPSSTRTDTRFPYTTRFRSWQRTDFTAHNALASWICEQWALPRPWPPTSSSLDMVRRARIRNLIDKEADAAWPATLLAYTGPVPSRSEEHTSELQSLMRISYAVFCLKKKTNKNHQHKK